MKLEKMKQILTKSEIELHVGFLYASPIIYEDFDTKTGKKGYQVPPQLTFRNEMQVIKKVLKESG